MKYKDFEKQIDLVEFSDVKTLSLGNDIYQVVAFVITLKNEQTLELRCYLEDGKLAEDFSILMYHIGLEFQCFYGCSEEEVFSECEIKNNKLLLKEIAQNVIAEQKLALLLNDIHIKEQGW